MPISQIIIVFYFYIGFLQIYIINNNKEFKVIDTMHVSFDNIKGNVDFSPFLNDLYWIPIKMVVPNGSKSLEEGAEVSSEFQNLM